MRFVGCLLVVFGWADAALAITVLEKQVNASATACVSRFDFDIGDMLYFNEQASTAAPGSVSVLDAAWASVSFGANASSLGISGTGNVMARGDFQMGGGCATAAASASADVSFMLTAPADISLSLSAGQEYATPSLLITLTGPGMQEIWHVADFGQHLEDLQMQTTLAPGTYRLTASGTASGSNNIDNTGNPQEDFSFDINIQGTPVPEPSSVATLAVGGTILTLARRRLRRAARQAASPNY